MDKKIDLDKFLCSFGQGKLPRLSYFYIIINCRRGVNLQVQSDLSRLLNSIRGIKLQSSRRDFIGVI